MNTTEIDIKALHPNEGQLKGLPKNPRFIRDTKFQKLLQSIKDDPEMLNLRELIVYDTADPKLQYIIIGGNMRYRAMKDLGYKTAPCKVLAPGFPMDKMRRIALKDNSNFGEMDFDILLNEWDAAEIASAAIDVPGVVNDALTDQEEAEAQAADDRDNDKPTIKDPSSTITVCCVSLFGLTYDSILFAELTQEQADRIKESADKMGAEETLERMIKAI